jgi:hypothetical protein
MRPAISKGILPATLGMILAALAGCHSFHIDTTVENRSGAAIQLLEVDYPSASFGTGSIAAGADFHYRFQVRGSGPIKLQYTAGSSHVEKTGPALAEHQEGRLEIVLLPGGQVDFHPQLTPQP